MERIVFDETAAATYDADSESMFDPAVLDPEVDFLAGLANHGSALEFGIGTGRVAIPLSQRGIRVHGIDISEPMVARLREKPGADGITTHIGDFATTRLGTPFELVYIVFNAVTNLASQDEQVACFQNAAAHLVPGGFLVAAVFVPELRRLPRGDTFRTSTVTPAHVAFDEYDVVNQRCTSHHYFIRDGAVRRFLTEHRYVWPAELDLMARMAGMSLHQRWGDWTRSPFTADSTDHVSVWQKRAE
jgi:SAM-dependent methyltransferase